MQLGLTGVIHLPPMPGDPLAAGLDFKDVEHHALRDAKRLAEGGATAVILENFGSHPFIKGDISERTPPHQVALMAVLARQIKRETNLKLGINCLRNDAISAIGIASATQADFIRVNVHIGAYLTDQGIIEGEAARSLRYRHSLDADDIAIWADVLVKHATPLAPITIAQAVHDTVLRGLADVVIITGPSTGAPVTRADLIAARVSTGDAKMVIGSGLTNDNAEELLPLADGAIVGTALKKGGILSNAVDVDRVKAMADLIASYQSK
ncbi:BtpA/SgcQ family protein [Myxococcota bacterium]|nr:BtpA/SgcQ family protein [Myxococcota bacterium]